MRSPLSLHQSQDEGLSLSVDKAQARIGRPLTPGSIAGVNRRIIGARDIIPTEPITIIATTAAITIIATMAAITVTATTATTTIIGATHITVIAIGSICEGVQLPWGGPQHAAAASALADYASRRLTRFPLAVATDHIL